MEYIKNLNNKDPAHGTTQTNQDTCIKEMYSCGRKCETVPAISNLIGLATIIAVLGFMVFRFVNSPSSTGLSPMFDFMKSQEIFKLFIGLMLLSHVKTLSNSLIANIVLPFIRPFLPFFSCNLKIKLGLFCLNIGAFISDLLVFLVNIYIIYFMFVIAY